MNNLSCEYIKYLSRKSNDDSSSLLLEMMDRYNVVALKDLTDEQIAKFYEEVVKNEREAEVSQFNKANKIQII